MDETQYPKGVIAFTPRKGANEKLLAEVIITPELFKEWFESVPDFHQEFKGQKQVKLGLWQNSKGGRHLTCIIPKKDV